MLAPVLVMAIVHNVRSEGCKKMKSPCKNKHVREPHLRSRPSQQSVQGLCTTTHLDYQRCCYHFDIYSSFEVPIILLLDYILIAWQPFRNSSLALECQRIEESITSNGQYK